MPLRQSSPGHGLLWRTLVLLGLGLAAAAVGYWLGAQGVPTELDASQARAAAAASAEDRAFRSAHAAAYQQGVQVGRENGSRAGTEAGTRDGEAEARRVLAEAEAARKAQAAQDAAARRAQAQRAPAQSRRTGCNEPLFPEGYCPTPEEIQQENDAESLCGPGTEAGRAEARRRGINC